jgi:hypothetical protein
MSLINDALKQARKAPPRNMPSSLPPLQSVSDEPSPVTAWLLPAIVIILVVAAIFFIGWAVAHHTVHTIVTAPENANSTQQVATITVPVITPRPVEPPPPVNPPDSPKLQGIFYSPTSPSAIIDGKIVRPGDQYQDYKVKAISKYTVTLVGKDKKEIQIGMDSN